MSRELKFRAWGKNIKEYMGDGKGACNVVNILGDLLKQGGWVIEQYTGLNDKNGKEIYEGDIVRLYEHDWWDGKIVKHHKNPRVEGNFVVYYDDDLAAFEMENTQPYDNGIRGIEPFGFASQEYEVVGNIHENPELLSKPIDKP